MSAGADSLRSILFALGANFVIFLSKLGAALYTGSGAMLAEAIHSLADTGNQGLLILGLKRARRLPSPNFPLGYGKAIYFWSFIVALLLFSMGGLFSIYEGAHKILMPEPIRAPWLAIGILAFGLVAESVSLWGCLREVNKVRGGRSLWQWVKETRQSELVVVLGEDIAALLGLFLALVAVMVTMLTGDPIYDALGSVAIGAVLVLVAVAIGAKIKGLLIGESVEESLRQAIERHIAGQDGVAQVLNLITLQLGEDVMVAVKARMAEFSSQADMILAINRVEAALKAAHPQVRWIFFEPDLAA